MQKVTLMRIVRRCPCLYLCDIIKDNICPVRYVISVYVANRNKSGSRAWLYEIEDARKYQLVTKTWQRT